MGEAAKIARLQLIIGLFAPDRMGSVVSVGSKEDEKANTSPNRNKQCQRKRPPPPCEGIATAFRRERFLLNTEDILSVEIIMPGLPREHVEGDTEIRNGFFQLHG